MGLEPTSGTVGLLATRERESDCGQLSNPSREWPQFKVYRGCAGGKVQSDRRRLRLVTPTGLEPVFSP